MAGPKFLRDLFSKYNKQQDWVIRTIIQSDEDGSFSLLVCDTKVLKKHQQGVCSVYVHVWCV